MEIVIVGGSGGIGQALVRKMLEVYSKARVTGTFHRHRPDYQHERLEWVSVDITNEEDIKSLASRFESIDMMINAVGFLHDQSRMPEKAVKEFESGFFQKNIQLNTLPSVFLAKHFQKTIKKNTRTHFIALSAKIGSINDNRIGGWLSYRASKAALNMAMKTISIEWQRTLPECRVILFHPGTTDTALSKPFQKNLPDGQLHATNLTAEALLLLIQDDKGASCEFMSFDGTRILW